MTTSVTTKAPAKPVSVKSIKSQLMLKRARAGQEILPKAAKGAK